MRDAAELLETAVRDTLDALALGDEDTAARKLAVRYAQIIDQCDDQAWAVRWLAPGLLDVLESLGATPGARARLKGGKPGDAPPNRLAVLRAASRR